MTLTDLIIAACGSPSPFIIRVFVAEHESPEMLSETVKELQ